LEKSKEELVALEAKVIQVPKKNIIALERSKQKSLEEIQDEEQQSSIIICTHQVKYKFLFGK
jgi:hypothetical protein